MKSNYEEAIKAKLAELDIAGKESANFRAINLNSGQPIQIMDINDMAIAFSKEDLILEEFKLLLERAYPSRTNHSVIVQDFEEKIAKAKLRVEEAEKRDL